MNYLRKAGKLFIAACLFAGMSMTTGTVSASELQTHIMTVQNESTTLKELFDLIEEKFDYTFLIRNNDIDLNERINIDMTNRSVEEILNYALKNQKAEFTVSDNRIVVYKSNKPRQAAPAPVAQQAQRITGVVIDQTTGEPVIGANVMIKGTTTGTSTDFDGNFSLETPAGATLVVSYIGYVNLEVLAAPNMTIRLREDTQALEEVVVVGYSTQRRESLTGALNTLKSEKLLTQTSANVEGMISGKAPGVFVAPGDGRPGSKGNILIRGKASINGNTDPLWVVDGVIIGNNSGYAVNPTDIETMTILKDAASTAIYGSQGANGVVVITTKRATEKVVVNFSGKIGFNDAYNGNLEMMNGSELYDYFKSFNNQESITFPRWSEDLRNSNFDWWNFATRSGFVQDYNLSISGGSEKVKSYFSIGYLDEQGTVKGLDFDQYSIRFRTEYKPLDWLTIKPMVSGTKRHQVSKEYSTTAMYSNLPWDSPYMADGSITPHYSDTWVNSNSTNYLYDLQWNGGEYDRYSFFGNLDFDVRITDWLTFSSVNNLNWSNYAYKYLTDPRSNVGSGVNGRLEELSEWTTRRYTNQLLRFNKSFGKHNVNGIVAYEFTDYKFKRVQTIGTGFVPGFSVLDVTSVPEKTAGYINEYATQSYFFNANYAYDNKYLAQFSIRRDGASNFGDNAKYGNFFSVSGGWNMHRESFMESFTWIDQLKLRVNYGTTGNRPSSLYPQYDLYSVSASYKENAGTLISQIGNKDLTWEETATFGVGVDFSFLERFRVTADYYNKYTDNVLFNVPISGLTGVTSIWQNIGEIENRGVELTLGADIVQNKDWYWSVDLNLGKNTNKVKKLYEGVDEIVNTNFGGPAGSISRLLKPGYSSDTYYSREWAGVNPDNGAPQWYKTDENGNRVVTEKYAEADEVICGEYTPDFYGGFSTNLQWKQFDLNAVFSFSVGGKIYNYSRTEYDSDGTYTDRNQMKLLSSWSRWEKPGDKATHPVAVYENKSLANSVSSRYLEDGDYLKLRNLSIGYNLQLPQYKIQNLRLSITAENLFTLTGYSGTDPEIPVNEGKVTGVTGASNYPIVRKFMFGINFTL